MSIVVENLEVKPEAASKSASTQQAPPPPPASPARLNPVEIEKAFHRMLERLERLQAS